MMKRGPLSPERIVEIEEALIRADLGLDASAQIAEIMAAGRYRNLGESAGRARRRGREADGAGRQAADDRSRDKPFVILVVGVNGSGKTTTIGKLAAQLPSRGPRGDARRRRHVPRRGDRAAEDLGRAHRRERHRPRRQGADAAGLAFDALAEARDEGIDVLLIDTAGRLQNRTELMDELEKIVRVMKKVDATAPHAVLLVLDATVGQNALSQVEIFRKIAGVTGLVMTKLDGTARGGILVAIAAKFGLPVHFIGVGEGDRRSRAVRRRGFRPAIAGTA